MSDTEIITDGGRRRWSAAEKLRIVEETLDDRLNDRKKPRRRYYKAQDAALVPLITTLVAARQTYGYRRITAILNRQLRSEGLTPVNHKRVYRIMKAHNRKHPPKAAAVLY